ncbi:MAG: 4Fe-4S binding protein [Magnetococcales bacterium]|nr:4Fe-4S binding protein [Magnetococcales bacterium]
MPAVTQSTYCLPDDAHLMIHPGMPPTWGWAILVGVCLIAGYALLAKPPATRPARFWPLQRLPLLGPLQTFLTASPWPLVVLRLITTAVLLLVMAAGLWGVPWPERNFATTFTWILWWTLVILSVFWLGSAWCAICPWDALAVWLNRRHWWRRGETDHGLGWRLPAPLRTVWPALVLLIGLTWLELGVGLPANPEATALLALLMVVLTTTSQALFERKSFCRYACPIGRTIGFYAQLAPLELRPVQPDRCRSCTTLECYHGSQEMEPCPTFLTMGRLTQNTYCLSCGACLLSCPEHNIAWRLRPMATEAAVGARPHWDEAWFMVLLLALTTFHGLTMLPAWEASQCAMIPFLSTLVGNRGGWLLAFSLGMGVCLVVPVLLYTLAVAVTHRLAGTRLPFRRVFALCSFAVLPVAFAYHLAHNLSHLVRESAGISQVMLNPFGSGTLPMTAMEQQWRMMTLLIPESWLYVCQGGLFLLGYGLAVAIVRQRIGVLGRQRRILLPLLLFLGGCTGLNLWLVVQNMVMRL